MQQDGETGSGTALRKPVLAALAAVGLLVLLSSLGAGTTLAPNWANFTSGDLSEIGSLDGGGSSIAVNDNLDLSDNALTSVDWSNSDDGSGSNLDADLWDGFEHENTLDGRNVFGTFTGSGEEYVKLGRVKSNNERFTVELIGGRDRGHKSTRHVRVFGWKRFSDEGGTYMESGENSPDQSQNFDVETSDVLIVSSPNDLDRDGNNDTVIYVEAGDFSATKAIVETRDSNNFVREKQMGLSRSDINGTVVLETDNQVSEHELHVGETDVDRVISNKWTTVEDTTTQAIDDAVDKYNYVKLQANTTYSGSATIDINASDRTVYVDAGGATIDYTGSGTAVRVEQGTGGFDDRVVWRGGIIEGFNGNDPENGFVIEDGPYRSTVELDNVKSFTNCVQLRNPNGFVEGTRITLNEFRYCDNGVLAKGATAINGNGGTDSFKNTYMDVNGHSGGNTGINLTNAHMYDSTIKANLFLTTGIGMYMSDDGNSGVNGMANGRVYLTTEDTTNNGDEDGTGVVIDGNAPTPMFIQPNIGGVKWKFNTSQTVPVVDGDEEGLKLKDGDTEVIRSKSGDTEVKTPLNVSGGHLTLGETSVHSRIVDEASDSRIQFSTGGPIIFRSTATPNFGFTFNDGNDDNLFEIQTDGDTYVHQNDLHLEGNDIDDVSYTNHTVQSGNLATCDSGYEGAVAYNGSHWGCDGTSWNKLY